MTTDEIINLIQMIRTKNNKYWMDMLRLAFRDSPKEASKIMAHITECDSEITKLTKQLGESKWQ